MGKTGAWSFSWGAHYSYLGTCRHTVLMSRAAPPLPLTTEFQSCVGSERLLQWSWLPCLRHPFTVVLKADALEFTLHKYQVSLHSGCSWERHLSSSVTLSIQSKAVASLSLLSRTSHLNLPQWSWSPKLFTNPVSSPMKGHCIFEVNSKLDELNKSSQKVIMGEAMHVPLMVTLET